MRKLINAIPFVTASLFALALTVGLGGGTASATATSVTTHTEIPFAGTFFVPCANGGAGEVVVSSGEMRAVVHSTFDDAGGIHVALHIRPDVSGIGQTTGDRYQGVGSEEFESNGAGALEFTVANNFSLIGQGPGDNLLTHITMHVTVDAEGNLTATVTNSSIDCK